MSHKECFLENKNSPGRHHNPDCWSCFRETLLLICLLAFLVKINVKCTRLEIANRNIRLGHASHQVQQNKFQTRFPKCPEWIPINMLYEWKGSVRYCARCISERRQQMEKRNKIYVANNKLMKRTRISSARETLKFNKLLYFARTFYGKIKCWRNEKRIIHISNRIKSFPSRLRRGRRWKEKESVLCGA